MRERVRWLEFDCFDESDEVGANVMRVSGSVTAVDEPGMSSSGRRLPHLTAGHAALILRIGAEEQDRPGALRESPRASNAQVAETTEVHVGHELAYLPTVVGRAGASVTLVLVASGLLAAGGPESGQTSRNDVASRGLVPGGPRPAARAEPGDPGARLETSETRSMQKQFMGVAAVGAALAIGDASHAQAVQWRVEDGGNGHWYQLIVSGPISWANARLACEELGGHLATPRSATEDSFILSISNRSTYPSAWVNDFGGNASGPWLGGYQPANASPSQPWAWVTGEPWAWAGWAAGEPNGGFVPGLQTTCMLGYAGSNFYRGWADISSDMIPPYPGSISYIVEWSADCNADGIVDYGQILQGQLPDTNNNGVPDSCEVLTCANADLFRDSNINGADLGILLAQWGEANPQTVSDINRDGAVDGVDLGLLLSFWGPCPD